MLCGRDGLGDGPRGFQKTIGERIPGGGRSATEDAFVFGSGWIDEPGRGFSAAGIDDQQKVTGGRFKARFRDVSDGRHGG
jgi:hypothetical protein